MINKRPIVLPRLTENVSPVVDHVNPPLIDFKTPVDLVSEEESNKSLNPRPKSMPNLFMCGESFAVKQCWVESALVQADKLLESDTFRRAISHL